MSRSFRREVPQHEPTRAKRLAQRRTIVICRSPTLRVHCAGLNAADVLSCETPNSACIPLGTTGGRVWCGQRSPPAGGDPGLAEVRVGENETFESALRRFNKKIQQSGILAEARRREHYEKPSVKRKRKEAKRKKAARQE